MRRLRQENYFPVIVSVHFLMWAVDLAMYQGSFHDADVDTLLFGTYSTAPGELTWSRIVGEMFSSWVVTVFAFNFLMATRARWVERLFGGLDKMYLIHRRSGKIAVALLILHFIFVPRDLTVFTIGKPMGFYALVGILLGVVLAAAPALKKRIPYQRWLPMHRLMGALYLLGIAHAFNVHALIWELPIVRVYVFGMAMMGVLAWLYKTFLHPFVHPRTHHTVTHVHPRGDVLDIQLDGAVARRAGQFGFLTFPEISREAHPFTIASPPGEPPRFLIKALGDYSADLPEKLKVGAKARLEAPFGHFVPQHARYTKQVWVAGGIGITPFLAMFDTKDARDVTLYWCLPNGDAPLIDEVERLAADSDVTLVVWASDSKGYLTVSNLGELDWGQTSFLLCGPPAMKTAFRTALMSKGVGRDDILDEEFAFR